MRAECRAGPGGARMRHVSQPPRATAARDRLACVDRLARRKRAQRLEGRRSTSGALVGALTSGRACSCSTGPRTRPQTAVHGGASTTPCPKGWCASSPWPSEDIDMSATRGSTRIGAVTWSSRPARDTRWSSAWSCACVAERVAGASPPVYLYAEGPSGPTASSGGRRAPVEASWPALLKVGTRLRSAGMHPREGATPSRAAVLFAWNVTCLGRSWSSPSGCAPRLRVGGGLPRVQANGFRVEEPSAATRSSPGVMNCGLSGNPIWQAWRPSASGR